MMTNDACWNVNETAYDRNPYSFPTARLNPGPFEKFRDISPIFSIQSPLP
jgi:hypothetical protein